MLKFFLQRCPVQFAVVVVDGVQGKLFQRAKLFNHALHAAFGHADQVGAGLRVDDVLIQRAKPDCHPLADGIPAGIVRRAVDPHAGSDFFQILLQIIGILVQFRDSKRRRCVVHNSHSHKLYPP